MCDPAKSVTFMKRFNKYGSYDPLFLSRRNKWTRRGLSWPRLHRWTETLMMYVLTLRTSNLTNMLRSNFVEKKQITKQKFISPLPSSLLSPLVFSETFGKRFTHCLLDSTTDEGYIRVKVRYFSGDLCFYEQGFLFLLLLRSILEEKQNLHYPGNAEPR